jgi:hypothetical protein
MSHDSDALRDSAAKCRRLAAGVGDRKTADALEELAEDYVHRAERMDDSERRLRDAEGSGAMSPRQDLG